MNWYYNKANNFWYNNKYEIKPVEKGVVIYKEGIYYKPAKTVLAAKRMLEGAI